MLHQINDTTYSVDNLGDVKPSVLIGGKTADKFIPNVNISFYDDEFFFNLNCIDDIVADESATKIDGVISRTINNEKHEYYIDDSGRLKWDKLFSACPESMRVRFKVRKSAGIHFFYQGELTAEEIADGCIRPDDIKGSYAVYCDKANNKYKTGKLCHIPRPFVIDASGNREWCVMTYEEISDVEGILSITLPESFMHSADYSTGAVRLDPTIGYSTTGASSYLSNIQVTARTSVTMPENGVASKLYVYLNGDGTAEDILLGLFNNNVGAMGTLFAGPNTLTVSSATPAWYSSDISGALVSGTIYYPSCVINANPAADHNRIYYDSGSSGDSWYLNTRTMVDSPVGISDNWRYSVYCEYTLSSSGNKYYYQQMQM